MCSHNERKLLEEIVMLNSLVYRLESQIIKLESELEGLRTQTVNTKRPFIIELVTKFFMHFGSLLDLGAVSLPGGRGAFRLRNGLETTRTYPFNIGSAPMSAVDQAREVMAALNLNKTQLADVLGLSHITLYDWVDGKGPKVATAQRLTRLVQILVNAGVTATNSISPRFVRESLNNGEPSLLELLKADTLDEARLAKVLAHAKGLEVDAEGTRVAREARLRALGFEEPTAEQRKENLAINVALCKWPKD